MTKKSPKSTGKPVKPLAKVSLKAKTKPAKKAAPRSPQATTDDDLYDQGDIATPRRDPPYEDGL